MLVVDLVVETNERVQQRVDVLLDAHAAGGDAVARQLVRERVDLRLRDAGGGDGGVHQPVRRRGIEERTGGRRVLIARFDGGKEAELVLEDRAAERGAELTTEERRVAQERRVAAHLLVAVIHERRALELVGARLRHGVDERTGEVALAHVVRRDEDLEFLDGVEGQRTATDLGTDRGRRTETEAVRERYTVDLDVVEAVILAGGGDAAVGRHVHLRRVTREVREVTVERGEAARERVREDRLRTGAGGGEVGRRGRGAGRDASELRDLIFEVDVEARGLREADRDRGRRVLLVADAAHVDGVLAHFEVGHEVATVVARDGARAGAVRLVDDFDLRVGDRRLLRVGDGPGDGAGRRPLRQHRRGGGQ